MNTTNANVKAEKMTRELCSASMTTRHISLYASHILPRSLNLHEAARNILNMFDSGVVRELRSAQAINASYNGMLLTPDRGH